MTNKKIERQAHHKPDAPDTNTHPPIFTPAENLSNSFLMTREEVARLLNCSKATVVALSRAGHIQLIETPLGVRYEGMAALAVWRRGRPFMGKWKC
jgi:excisionase family DNA binding protein